jgi:hypothetical protein
MTPRTAAIVALACLTAGAAACRSSRKQTGGSALKLDGQSGYAEAAFREPDPFVEQATLEAWVYLDELPSATGRAFAIVGKPGAGRDLDLQVGPDDRFSFSVAGGAPSVAVSRSKVNRGLWYRVDASYQAAAFLTLYVNGALEAVIPIAARRQPNTGPIVVGENPVSPNRFFEGRIDEVALWNRARTPEEIGPKPRALTGHEEGLVAAYRFERDGGDSVTPGHPLVLHPGAAVASPGAPVE